MSETDPPQPQPPRQHTPFLAGIYGAIHAVIDATCALVVMSTVLIHGLTPSQSFGLVLVYDLLAFGSQALLGFITDQLRAPRAATLAGIVGTALALILMRTEPYTAAVLAGIGNSLFHVGAGALTLHTRPGRAADPGIFVAPGALGLALGMWMGRTGKQFVWPLMAIFLVALAISLVVTMLLRHPPMPYRGGDEDPERGPQPVSANVNRGTGAAIVSLLLVSITVRSLVGMGGCHACPRETLAALGMPLAAFGGKLLGGIVSDRLGWIETSVGALLLSAPLIAFGGGNPAVIIPGLFLFQMTMPVTLVAVVMVFPRRPAFAFGLCCVALIAGAAPTFLPEVRAFYSSWLFFTLILASATSVLVGLRLMGSSIPTKKLLRWLYQ